MPRPTSSRRRQRSVRVTVALALLATATVLVLLALWAATVPALAAAAVVAVGCGWAAARIVHLELRQTRREHARERAAQARAFRDAFVRSSREHAARTAAVAGRLRGAEREVRELEATLRLSERRATDAESRARRESRRLVEAQQRVAELEDALAIRRAEEADELASWTAYADADTVVDLLAWEDRAGRTERAREGGLGRRHA